MKVRLKRVLLEYVLGLGVAAVLVVYGAFALGVRRAFLPGLKVQHSLLTGGQGAALALAYLAGGLYLAVRFFVHPRCQSRFAQGQAYLAEDGLLIVLITAVVYVLLKVGTVGGL